MGRELVFRFVADGDDVHELEVFHKLLKIDDYGFVLEEFASWMGKYLKHVEESEWPNLDDVSNKFYELLNKREIDLF